MSTPFPPSTFRAWQYSRTTGGLPRNLSINPKTPLPIPKPNQHLVQILAIALNPIDYKPAENPLLGRLLIPKPATPGLDFVGRIVTPAKGSQLTEGQLVFGAAGSSPVAGGGLAEFAVAGVEAVVAVLEGVEAVDAATVAVAGLSAYQTIVPKVKKGDRIFINGGSGGCGVFGIQIAKAVGCHVTTSCSSGNVELCKSLGADEVVDYTKGSVVEALKRSGQLFDHVVDNVGADHSLYWRCHEYTRPGAVFVTVGGDLRLGSLLGTLKMSLLPGALGGGRRKRESFFAQPKSEDLEQIGRWMKEGKVRAVIDQRFPFDQAPAAFEKLKTGRAKGKIVIDVTSDTHQKR